MRAPPEARTSPFALGHVGTARASEPQSCHEYVCVLPPIPTCACPPLSLPPHCTPPKLAEATSGSEPQGAADAHRARRPATDRGALFLLCSATSESRCGSAATMRLCACLPAAPKRVNGELRSASRRTESGASAAFGLGRTVCVGRQLACPLTVDGNLPRAAAAFLSRSVGALDRARSRHRQARSRNGQELPDRPSPRATPPQSPTSCPRGSVRRQ